jgi:hypothetical protein
MVPKSSGLSPAHGRLEEFITLSPLPREESGMAFMASPSQLKILTQAVDEYCRDYGVMDDKERLYVAEIVSSLFEAGAISLNDLRRGLDTAIGKQGRQA